jgi:phosphoribosylanthranilate isomerase
VLYAKSPRHRPGRPPNWPTALPPFVTPVLLFVNAAAGRGARPPSAMPQALLQFHGDETPEPSASAGRAPYLRAARMAPGFDLLDFAARFPGAQALLLDARSRVRGRRKGFDWSLIPPSVPLPVVLSGGLNPANVIDGVLARPALGR